MNGPLVFVAFLAPIVYSLSFGAPSVGAFSIFLLLIHPPRKKKKLTPDTWKICPRALHITFEIKARLEAWFRASHDPIATAALKHAP